MKIKKEKQGIDTVGFIRASSLPRCRDIVRIKLAAKTCMNDRDSRKKQYGSVTVSFGATVSSI